MAKRRDNKGIMVRLEPDIHKEVAETAKALNVSAGGLVRQMLMVIMGKEDKLNAVLSARLRQLTGRAE